MKLMIASDLHGSSYWCARMLEAYKKEQPDLILMDIRMPDLDGLAATRRIRETDPDVKIIALSAFAYDSDKQKAFDAGCNDYMVKPISPSQLKRIIQIYL